MKAVILEQDKSETAILEKLILENFPGFKSVVSLRSVKEGKAYFENSNNADLVFSNWSLADGHSSEVLSCIYPPVPVIFIGKDTTHLKQALDHNAVGYIAKPVNQDQLQKTFLKFRTLKDHFTRRPDVSLSALLGRKGRLIVRQRGGFRVLSYDDIVLIYAHRKMAYALDRKMDMFLISRNLNFLAAELDPLLFFRANRQYILNLQHIVNFKPVDSGKIAVQMNVPAANIHSQILVSREMASKFYNWIESA